MLDDKTIEARFTATDLKVADFTNAEWDKAATVQINRYWSGEPAPLERQAEARILWSEKALHLRFVCHQGEPLVVNDKPQTEKKTMGLWDRDVCEIFIAPGPNTRSKDILNLKLRPPENGWTWRFTGHRTVGNPTGNFIRE